MAFKDREAFFQGVRSYVPGMQFASDISEGSITPFSLGTPAASDDDIIDASVDADATAGTEEAQDYTSDSPYGRTLIVTPSADPGAAGGVMDVYGFDYLYQPMVERFSGANGSTAILYGKKAFYKVTKTKIVTATTNAITYKLGTGFRVGLPYKGDVMWAKESNAFVPLFKRDVTVWRRLDGAAVGGGPSGSWVYAEFPGFVKTIRGTADMPAGSTNDPAVTVELGGTAITGLTITLDTSAAATGSLLSDTPTTAGYSANNRFRPGSLIEIVAADADTSGAITVGLELTPTQFTPAVITDPATSTTGDPRGTYESIMTMDGAAEIVVGMIGDNYINSSNNGGLHGIQHYYP